MALNKLEGFNNFTAKLEFFFLFTFFLRLEEEKKKGCKEKNVSDIQMIFWKTFNKFLLVSTGIDMTLNIFDPYLQFPSQT